MSNAERSVVLQARGLKKTYQEGTLRVPVLHGVDMEVCKGEKVAIVGSSGSGKSTLLHLFGGLDTPSEGEVIVCGTELSGLSDKARGRLRIPALVWSTSSTTCCRNSPRWKMSQCRY
jgi:lipoprotein-releasing system ATP-binding protein